MKADVSFNNFARAKIDHDMMGRYDLPVYQSGVDMDENFITNFKGNAIYRSGFESMVEFQDCVLIEFKFNIQQQYICVFYLNKIRFLSYDVNGDFGWVLNTGTPLEVATPYTLAQCDDLDYTQNNDVMVFTHKDFEPYKLTRTAADNFTFVTFARKLDPFPLTYSASKVITAITQATNAQVSVAAHGYVVGDRVRILAVVGMTQINTYVARVVTVPTAGTFTIDVDTTLFTAYGSAGTTEKVSTGDYPRCCLFYKGRLYYGSTRLKITTLFASNSGLYDDFTLLPVTATTALIVTIAEIAQSFEWLFPGDNSLIVGASDGIVAVNGGAVNEPITAATVEATLTSAPPCNGVYPLKKDGLIFYVGVDGRNMYHFSYDLLKESFQAADVNFISYDITQGGITKIRFKKDRNDLIFCTTGNDTGSMLSCNFFLGAENIIGWHDHITGNDGLFLDEAVITDNNGAPQLFTLVLRGSDYFIERQAKYVEFKQRVKFFTPPSGTKFEEMDAYETADTTAYNRYVAEQMKTCIFVDGSLTYNNIQSNLITYNSGAGTVTATSNVFAAGDVGKHIVYKTITGYESGRFEITGYTTAKIVTVSVLQDPTSSTYTDWYLSFSEITSGLSQFDGTTVSVVADGGYLSDFPVSGGACDFEQQVTHVVIGYKYKGILKSFGLGFQVQGINTQITMKNISNFSVRCVATAGLRVGSSLYKTEPVQDLSPDDINYLPPIPIDGTKNIQFTDRSDEDKYFYVVQEDPLPATVTGVILTANYTVTP